MSLGGIDGLRVVERAYAQARTKPVWTGGLLEPRDWNLFFSGPTKWNTSKPIIVDNEASVEVELEYSLEGAPVFVTSVQLGDRPRYTGITPIFQTYLGQGPLGPRCSRDPQLDGWVRYYDRAIRLNASPIKRARLEFRLVRPPKESETKDKRWKIAKIMQPFAETLSEPLTLSDKALARFDLYTFDDRLAAAGASTTGRMRLAMELGVSPFAGLEFTPLSGGGSLQAYSTDGRVLCFRVSSDDQPRAALVFFRDGSEVRRVPEMETGRYIRTVAVSPDGSRALLVWASEAGSTLEDMEIESGRRDAVKSPVRFVSLAAFADAAHYVLLGENDLGPDSDSLFLVNRVGGGHRVLLTSVSDANEIQMSPDGVQAVVTTTDVTESGGLHTRLHHWIDLGSGQSLTLPDTLGELVLFKTDSDEVLMVRGFEVLSGSRKDPCSARVIMRLRRHDTDHFVLQGARVLEGKGFLYGLIDGNQQYVTRLDYRDASGSTFSMTLPIASLYVCPGGRFALISRPGSTGVERVDLGAAPDTAFLRGIHMERNARPQRGT